MDSEMRNCIILEEKNNRANLCLSVLATEAEEFYWVNSASFLIEWQGDFNTGKAQFEFFQITTGGRIDGQPITALLPPGGK